MKPKHRMDELTKSTRQRTAVLEGRAKMAGDRIEELVSDYTKAYRIVASSALMIVLGSSVVSGQETRTLTDSPAFERIQLSDRFHGEGATFGDLDGDGHGDVAVGSWLYRGPDFRLKFQFYDGQEFDPLGYSDSFVMAVDDVDHDGWPDILAVGFPGAPAYWYQNPGVTNFAKGHWKRFEILDSVDNESPVFVDINSDGVLDLVCGHQGQYGYASRKPGSEKGVWDFTPVTPDNGYQRFTHGLGVGDVDNDGDLDLLEQNGWWANPGNRERSDAGSDELWAFNPVEFSSGGSQMFAVDLDGDQRNEVVTGLAAHGYGLVYYRSLNTQASRFEQVTIMGSPQPAEGKLGASSISEVAVSQLHAVEIADMNGDSVPDIVTGKRWWAHANHDPGHSEPSVLVCLFTQRRENGGRDSGLSFMPHVVDVSSGVGTQLAVGDVNADGLPDIVSGNKRGTYVFLQLDSREKAGELAQADAYAQRPAYASLEIKNGETVARLPALGDRPLNLGFETGDYTDWEARGPIANTALVPHQDADTANPGFWINTDQPGERMIGEIVSRPFKVSAATCELMVGGNGNREARVEVISQQSGKVLVSLVGSQPLERAEIDLSSWVGQLVRLRIVDHAEDGWVQFDNFHFVH